MNQKPVIWKTPSLSADALKIFAWVILILSNIGVIVIDRGIIRADPRDLSQALAEDPRLMKLAGTASIFQLLVGLAIPIFAMLLVEGYKNTSDRRRYLIMVTVVTIVSEVPYDFAMSGKFWDFSSQNAMFGTLVGLLMCFFFDIFKDQKGAAQTMIRGTIIAAGVIWCSLLRVQYGLCMVLLVSIFYLFYDKPLKKILYGIPVSLLYVTGPLAFYGIWCYNGKRNDRVPKLVYYAAYPLQLVILGAIARFVV